jgi:hypothetical protein
MNGYGNAFDATGRMLMTVRSTAPAAGPRSGATAGTAVGDSRNGLILAVICVAYLMVTLDATVMTLALPSAQDDLGFTNVDSSGS